MVFAYNLNEYYPLSQGNSWTYSVIEDEKNSKNMVKIEGREVINSLETIRMVDSEDSEEESILYVAIDSEGIKMYKISAENEYEIFNPPITIFPNLEIGQERKDSINSAHYNIEGVKMSEKSITANVSLESVEDVEVPAGKFSNCLKFSFIIDWSEANGNYGRDDSTMWLALGIGKVKEFRFSTEFNAETKEKNTGFVIYKLTSAIVDRKEIKEIGSQ